jgi:hypothetical protein
LQDGLGNDIGVSVNTAGDLFLSGSLTASLQQGYLYVGNASGKTTAFATSSLVTTVNTGSLVTTASFNAFTQSINSATQSLFTSASLGLTTASFSGNTLTFTKGNGTTFGIVIPDISGSTIDTGSFATTSSFNSYTSSTDNRLNNIETTTASLLVETQNLELFSASALISINALNVASASLQSFTSSQYVSNSYFATTGSNTFRGNETFQDAGGNASTLVPTSGSLMLVAKSFTSASAHITASVSNQVNLIFKNNDNTADTIISGSNNIFTNPAAITAGFKRYIGGSNNIALNSGSVPQISGSMGYSPTMANNFFGGAAGITVRGPVSSSAYAINHNLINNTTAFAIGSAAATDASRMVSGFTMASNVGSGFVRLQAYKTFLSSSVTYSTSTAAGVVDLNLHSSSVNYGGNISFGGTTINNSYYPTTVSSSNQTVTINSNIFVGTSNINFSGSNTTLTGSVVRALSNNLIVGYNSASLVLNGDNSSMYATSILGAGLRVTGSNNFIATSNSANNDFGSIFVGRWNAQDGNRARTAETVFAVGTGTSGSLKTGFLIDSGSNTFVEGSLNVSGSTSLTGSLTLNGSTITAVNTASFATTGSNSFNGNQTITGTLNVIGNSSFNGSQSITGSLTASGSISLNGLTLTRGPGNNNVGIGVNILQNAVSGGNVALGNDTLRDNTSGTDNVALGNSSLAANISGDRNMAIGSNTLDSNTTGTLNVAIGNATLAGLVDGTANIGIGFEALKNQTTGSFNVGIGSQALNQNITGSGNIAFGAKAGYNETGSNNFYINNTEYGSLNADRSGSLMWGTMNTTTANQTLQINARTRFTNEVLFTTGSNQQAGTAVLDGGNPGTVTVSNSLVTANSIIMLTKQTLAHSNGYVAVSSKGAGTFTITSNHNGDTDTVGWFIINNS